MILKQIIEGIELADFVVVDLRNENPNVTFEAAFAECMAKPVLYIHTVLHGLAAPGRLGPFDIANTIIAQLWQQEDLSLREEDESVIDAFASKLVNNEKINGVIETLLQEPPFLISPAQKAADSLVKNFIEPVSTAGLPFELVIPTDFELAMSRPNYRLRSPNPLSVRGANRYYVCDVVNGKVQDWPTNLSPIVDYYRNRKPSRGDELSRRFDRIWNREATAFRQVVENRCRRLPVTIVDEPGIAWERVP
jgi:hypothetical protein